MNPTRRLLLGVLKYPASYTATVQESAYGELKSPRWLSECKKQKPPKCYLDTEDKVVDWILEPLNSNIIEFTKLEPHKSGHLKPANKALDTSIMELADDISYSLHDLEDAISLGMITRTDWEDHNQAQEKDSNVLKVKRFNSCGLLNKEHRLLLDHIFELVENKVIKSTNVQQLEFKGQKLVMELFDTLASDPKRLLPSSTLSRYERQDSDSKRMRVICDYVSGMTLIFRVLKHI